MKCAILSIVPHVGDLTVGKIDKSFHPVNNTFQWKEADNT